MLVRDIMSTCIAECTEDAPLERVYAAMQNCGHNIVVVVEGKYHRTPIGVITGNTILEQIIGKGRDPKNLLAANVMTSKITKVSDTTSIALCPTTAELGQQGLPLIVVDDQRALCGLLTREVLRLSRTDRVLNEVHAHGAPSVDNTPLQGWTQ